MVENFFISGYSACDRRDQSFGCLDEFLQYDVDRDVLFVVRVLPSFGEAAEELDDTRALWEDMLDKGETDERLAFDLVEFLDLVGPSNRESVSEKLKAQKGETEVTPVCGPSLTDEELFPRNSKTSLQPTSSIHIGIMDPLCALKASLLPLRGWTGRLLSE
jgi:hypothetical protein